MENYQLRILLRYIQFVSLNEHIVYFSLLTAPQNIAVFIIEKNLLFIITLKLTILFNIIVTILIFLNFT